MQTFKGETLLDIYKQAVPFLLNTPEEIRSPRGQKVHEIIGAHIEITEPIMCGWNADAVTRPYPVQYLKDELCAYLACTNDLTVFEGISKFWGQLSDDKETVNSAYGQIVNDMRLTNKSYEQNAPWMDTSLQIQACWNEEVMTQVEWVLQSFKYDKDTRQAIMFVASPFFQYKGNKDFICTLNYHFIIDADNQLNMLVNRRSQDIHFGMTFDVPWEVTLQHIILVEVQKMYPEVTIGSYQLNCNSLHMYERNFDIYTNFEEDDSHVACWLPAIKENYFNNQFIKEKVEGSQNRYEGDDEFLEWLINE